MILLLFLKFLLAASFVQTLLIKRYEPDLRPQLSERQDAAAQSPTGRLVFCHFMMGIVAGRKGSFDYDADMRQGKELGIDAFALNIGTDEYTGKQLGYAYESAARNGMKLFISFDFHYFSPTNDAARVGQIIAAWANEPAQLKVDGKAFASSFVGDGLDVSAVKAAAGMDVFFAPNFTPDKGTNALSIEGALNWAAWPSNGANKAPTPDARVSVVAGDDKYHNWLAGAKKSYIAPISPWFSTHYGAEVSYGKNFVFPSDLLWYDRWNQVLQRSPPFVEIITWNDFGESHYIAPLSSQHEDDGASKWVNDMPHDGWRDLAQPFIAAYKAGSKSVNQYIKEDKIIYWYRPTPRTVNCDSTDNTMKPGNNDSGNYFNGRPNGWEDMQDSVFLVSLLKAPGSIQVTSGKNTQRFEAPAGACSFKLDMGVGQQKFSLTRNSQPVFSGISRRDITDACPCGLYNFNAYVGTLPEGKSDPLDAAGLASFSVGLTVKTCEAAPSLGPGSPAPVPSTAAGGGVGPTTGGGSPSGASPTGASGSGISVITATTPQTTAASQASPSGSQAQSPSGGPGDNPSGSPSVGPGIPSEISGGQPVVGSSSSLVTTPVSPSLTGSAAAPTSTEEGKSCNGGTNSPDQDPNIGGLCSFSCSRGYCPPDVCVCTSTGTPEFAPDTSTPGCPLEAEAESESYKGLCKFSCMRGYCPPGACTTQCE